MQRTTYDEEGYLKIIVSQNSVDQVSNEEFSHDIAWDNALVDALQDLVGERPKATPKEGILVTDMEIKLNGELTRRMVSTRATINSMQTER